MECKPTLRLLIVVVVVILCHDVLEIDKLFVKSLQLLS